VRVREGLGHETVAALFQSLSSQRPAVGSSDWLDVALAESGLDRLRSDHQHCDGILLPLGCCRGFYRCYGSFDCLMYRLTGWNFSNQARISARLNRGLIRRVNARASKGAISLINGCPDQRARRFPRRLSEERTDFRLSTRHKLKHRRRSPLSRPCECRDNHGESRWTAKMMRRLHRIRANFDNKR
jgi:hypothetical protein